MRLLADLRDHAPPASKERFTSGLCSWFDWTNAIALSSALEAQAAPKVEAGARLAAAVSADEREYRRVRTALSALIEPQAATPPAEDPGDFSPHRQRYLKSQQAMQAQIAPLRARLRKSLAETSADMARLAALDEVMEGAVSAREHALLGLVPSLLEQRFRRLRPTDASADQAGNWLDIFLGDMRQVLLAELELRMQPVLGLLEARQGHCQEHHE